jgi:hypothetical protein
VSPVAPAAVAAAIVLSAATCGSPTGPREVQPGQEFELAPGESARAPGGPLVRFLEVTSESRCPTDAVCVWAGDAVVAVTLSRVGSAPATVELHTAPALGDSASYGGFTVRLARLLPHPRSTGEIPAADYRATLVLARE